MSVSHNLTQLNGTNVRAVANEENNSSFPPEGYLQHFFDIRISRTEKVLETLAFGFFGFFGLFANIYIIYIAVSQKKIKKPFHCYLVNLASVNTLQCLIILSIAYSLAVEGWDFGKFLCDRQAESIAVLRGTTFYSISCMALNRLAAVLPHSRFSKMMAKKSLVICQLISTWVIPGILVGIPFIAIVVKDYLPILGMCDISLAFPADQFIKFIYWQLLVLILIPVLITTTSYVLLLREMYKRKQISSSQSISEMQKLITKLVFCIFAIFLCCWVPFTLYIFIDPYLLMPVFFIRLLFILNFSENLLNPLLCIIWMKDYQFKKPVTPDESTSMTSNI